MGFKHEKMWVTHPIFGKLFIATVAIYYVYMPTHFFGSNGHEELIRLYIWIVICSYYFLPVVILTFLFNFNL